MEISEIIDTIEVINDMIEDATYEHRKSYVFHLELRTIGYDNNVIMFLGEQIWSSGNDEREYINEEEGIYEPLSSFLSRKINKIINHINLLKV